MLKPKSEHNNKGEKGVALILATFAILFIGGMIGLAIDGGIAFFLKARLSQAMDAASLAGARSLSRGSDVTSQAASATTTAQNYFAANFPNHFWGCTVPVPTVAVWQDSVNTHIRYVQVTGNVTTPLYFLRTVGFTTASLTSTATAQRRDVNIMLVLDRSSSMGSNGAIAPSIAAAISFVNDFAAGRDELGAVIFGANYYLYAPNVNFQPGLINAINQTTSSGNTNTATALWAAYQQLVILNQPGALNVIVFFTDGLPNGITADMQSYRVRKGTYNAVTNPTGNGVTPQCGSGGAMTGVFSQWGGFATSGSTAGFWNPTTPGNIVSDPNDGALSETISNKTGCNFATNVNNTYEDFTQIPYYDFNGMPTSNISPNFPNNGASTSNGVVNAWTSTSLSWAQTANMYHTGFVQAWLNTAASGCTTPSGFDPPNNFGGSGACGLESPYIIGMASSNAADFAAQRWRHAATETDLNGIVPKVFGITLTEATGEWPDPMFMLRVTNTPSGFDNNGNPITNPIYSSNFPTGTYVNTSQKGELQQLWQSIASQILHLSQ
jgi:Flp pilus assembly protein TadG